MKIQEYIYRGFNLLVISIVSLAGAAFAAEIFLEKDWDDKIDDIGLLVLAIVGIVWYLTGNKKYARSAVPTVLIVLGLVDKIMAVIIEHKDKEAAGDDFGGIILFLFASILVIYQFSKTKKLAEQP